MLTFMSIWWEEPKQCLFFYMTEQTNCEALIALQGNRKVCINRRIFLKKQSSNFVHRK